VVEPVVVAGGLSGLGYVGYVANKYWPKGNRNIGTYGVPKVGKTMFNECLEFRKGGAAYVASRDWVSTTEWQHRYRTKIPDARRNLRGWDIPGGPHDVRKHIQVWNPIWILHMLSVETWDYPSNWNVAHEICNELNSPEYRQKYDVQYKEKYSLLRGERVMKKRWFTGGGCKVITIALNKIDIWEKKHNHEDLTALMRMVAHYYTQHHPSNPYSEIGERIPVRFIACSVDTGKYYDYSNLEKKKDLVEYIREITEYL
jgi:hypothetical protein